MIIRQIRGVRSISVLMSAAGFGPSTGWSWSVCCHWQRIGNRYLSSLLRSYYPCRGRRTGQLKGPSDPEAGTGSAGEERKKYMTESGNTAEREDYCFACGEANPIGLHLEFSENDGHFVTSISGSPETS